MSLSEVAEPESVSPGEKPTDPAPWTAFWPPVLLVLAGAAVYGGAFSGPFVLDDITSIHDNPTIRHLWPIWKALSPPAGEGLTPNGRPLVNLSLAINYAISGNAVWSYHALNFGIHLLAGLTLYGIVRRTLAPDAPGLSSNIAPVLAFTIALLWTVHPLQTESVTYIVQRAESMMGLFYLLTLYCFIRSANGDEETKRWRVPPPERSGSGRSAQREDGEAKPSPEGMPSAGALQGDGGTTRQRFVRPRWAVLSVLACLLGMACKEVMVSAPLIVLLYDRTFLSGTFAAAWRRHRSLLLALGATWLPLGYEVAITGNRGGTAGYGSHVVWWRYALTQFPAIAHYLRLCFWPHPLIFDYGMGLAAQWARVLPSAVLVFTLLGATLYGLVRSPALPRDALPRSPTWPVSFGWPAFGFAGAWFFAILAPSSSIVPIATETMAEHRMYLSLAPVIAVAVLLLYRGLNALFSASGSALAARITLGLGILVATGLGFATVRRNRDYRSNLALWTATTQNYPKNMRALYNLGCSLTEAGRTQEAVADFETVVRIQPDYTDAHQNLADGLVKLGRDEESLVHFEIAAHAHRDSSDIQCSLGIALLKTGRVEPAIAHLREALRLKPGMPEATYQLGEALLRAGKPAEALTLLESAQRERPDSADVKNALGNALFQVGRLSAAIDSYREALKIDPHFAKAHNNVGDVLLQLGQAEAATAEFRSALRDQSDFAEAHNNLGDALVDLGRPQEAIGEFQEAVRLQPDSADAHYNWANSLAKSGQLEVAAAQYREVLRLRPDFAQAHNNLGIALVQLDQMPEARREFAEALRLNPDNPDARDNLAKLNHLLQSQP